jgi:hypothetical protein
MIRRAHILLYAKDPGTDRVFFRGIWRLPTRFSQQLLLSFLLDVRLQPGQDLRPASMMIPRALAGQAGVGQTEQRDAVLLIEVEAYQRLQRILIPVRKPGKDEQSRTFDRAIFSTHGEVLTSSADAAGHSFTAGA